MRVFRRQDGALYKADEAKSENDSELLGPSHELLSVLPNSGKARGQDWIDLSVRMIKDGLLPENWFQQEEDKLDAKKS